MRNRKRLLIQFIFFTSPLLLLQGCGFRLINVDKPLSLCISGVSAEVIQEYIPVQCSKMSYQIIINQATSNQASVSSSTNDAVKQQQITRRIMFNLLSPKGKVIKKNVVISINEPLIINNNAILSSNAEQAILADEMQLELIQRLQSYLRHHIP
jgi:outer membrane lipopolysaccharide assembly protein LptE/RlpB